MKRDGTVLNANAVDQIKKLEQTINGNFESLNEVYFKDYSRMKTQTPQF